MLTKPLVPLLAVPLVNDSIPEIPRTPASTVRTITDPLDVVVPEPVLRLIEPPVTGVLVPADEIILPPAVVLPVPIERIMSPALPPSALPVEIFVIPDAPELVVPVENTSPPLIPRSPASYVLTTTPPLDLVVP